MCLLSFGKKICQYHTFILVFQWFLFKFFFSFVQFSERSFGSAEIVIFYINFKKKYTHGYRYSGYFYHRLLYKLNIVNFERKKRREAEKKIRREFFFLLFKRNQFVSLETVPVCFFFVHRTLQMHVDSHRWR